MTAAQLLLTNVSLPGRLSVDLRLRLNMVSPSRQMIMTTIGKPDSLYFLQFSGSIPSSIKFLGALGELSATPRHHLRTCHSQQHKTTETCYLDSNRLTGSLPAETFGNLDLLSKHANMVSG
jgi:hypothetical protein